MGHYPSGVSQGLSCFLGLMAEMITLLDYSLRRVSHSPNHWIYKQASCLNLSRTFLMTSSVALIYGHEFILCLKQRLTSEQSYDDETIKFLNQKVCFYYLNCVQVCLSVCVCVHRSVGTLRGCKRELDPVELVIGNCELLYIRVPSKRNTYPQPLSHLSNPKFCHLNIHIYIQFQYC